MSRNLTIIIAPGAFHRPTLYSGFADALRSLGFDRVIITKLASASASPPPEAFHRDVDNIRNAVERERTGCDVLLVAFSYSSIPACDALAALPEPENPMCSGKVRGIVFISGLIADQAQSLMTCQMDSAPAPWVRTEGELCHVNDPIPTFFNLSNQPWFFGLFNAATSAAKQLTPHALSSFLEPTQHAGWKQYPCTYVRCLRDNANSVEQQDFFIERLRAGAQRKVMVKDLESDHAPYVCMPGKLAKLVQEIVGEMAEAQKKRDSLIADARRISTSPFFPQWYNSAAP